MIGRAWGLLLWWAGAAVAIGVLLLLMDRLLPGFSLAGPVRAFVAGAAIALVVSLLWPVVYGIARRVPILLFPVVIFLLAGVLVWLGVAIANMAGAGVRIAGLGEAIWLAVALSAGLAILGALFSLDRGLGYDTMVTRPLRRAYRGTPKTGRSGILFLEIDGLSEPVLRRAIDDGHMPTLRNWLRSGSHRLDAWEPDLSSQTSASQAGILLGSNEGIPAFRWWDKPSGTLMVSSRRHTAEELERRLSTGRGLLVHGGGSRWNAFSGDAPDCLGTFSALGDRARSRSNAYVAWFANPFTLTRAIVLALGEVVRERAQAWRQVRDDVRPRIHRTWKYAFVRAGTTALLEEANKFVLASDVLRGVPSVYATFFGYDEVAHHSGIDRPDVFGVLHAIDADIAYIAGVAEHAPRPYEIVVLADHGQSMGATFRQRYGQTLADVVATLMAPGSRVAALLEADEELARFDAALAEVAPNRGRASALVRRVVARRLDDGGSTPVEPDPEGGILPVAVGGPKDATADSDAVVLASGNLGVISFPKVPHRMSLEEIAAAWPAMTPGLLAHPGISVLLVFSEKDGAVALGRAGVHFLEDGTSEGIDPLAPFGPNARRHLLRQSRFANCPDIVAISMFDPATGEVAAFEELVGSHGGLGGWQTRPFVLHPVGLDLGPFPVVGAAAMHDVLASWVCRLQGPFEH